MSTSSENPKNSASSETSTTSEASRNSKTSAPARPAADRSLKPKDLITVGTFTALYFVVFFGFGMLGLFGPVVHAIGIVLGSLANGIVFALYITRIRKPGMIFLTAMVSSLLMVLTGHAWTSLLAAAVFSALAEVVLARGHYRSARARVILLRTLLPVESSARYCRCTSSTTPIWPICEPRWARAMRRPGKPCSLRLS